MTELTIALNFIIIFLLVTAIIYGFVLNRRIKLIRESGRELTYLFRSFDNTIVKAQESVGELKKVSEAISEGLQGKIDKAALVIDDLEFLSEKATEATNKVSRALVQFKQMEKKLPAASVVKAREAASSPLTTSKPAPSKTMLPKKPSLQSSKKKALEDLLDDVSGESKYIDKKSKGVNSNKMQKSSLMPQNNTKKHSIASALKALGYGE